MEGWDNSTVLTAGSAGSVTEAALAIATLGPEGTSSEAAALHLATVSTAVSPRVMLFPSYECAAEEVLAERATHLLVANAYSHVNLFYMDLRFELRDTFVLDTPPYGIVAPYGRPLPLRVTIATHPAPVPLIEQLLPDGYLPAEVRMSPSTAAAADDVAAGEVDLALTTVSAAASRGLRFISRTRAIRMVWSAFCRSGPESP